MNNQVNRYAVLAAQPIHQLRQIAEVWGWRGLQQVHVVLDDGKLVWWYETTDKRFHLQINPHPIGQSEHYRATVVADRYGLPWEAVGFHDFSLPGAEDGVGHSAEALKPILFRQNYKDKEWRKRFKAKKT